MSEEGLMGGRVVFETLMGDYSPVYAEPSAAPAPKARLAERLPAPPTFRDEQSTRLVRWRRDVHGERREGGRTGEKEENIIISEEVHARKRRRPAAPPARLP